MIYPTKNVTECFDKLPVGKQYSKKESVSTGQVPIIDQSSDGIFAYHNEKPNIFASEKNPVITFANHTAAVRYVTHDFSVIQNVFPLRAKEQIFPRFLYFALVGLVETDGYKGHWPELVKKRIPVPTVGEQKRIAARIEKQFAKIDEVARVRAESEALASELLPAALHEIFSSTKSKGWEVKKIAEICEHPQYGFTASASRESVGPKFLRITDIQNGGMDWSSVPFCRCTTVAKYQLKSGDIVFARTGATVGKSFLITDVPGQAIFASYLIRLRVLASIIPEFLYYFFQSPDYWDQIGIGQTGMQPNVNGTKLAKIKIPFPPLAEQKAIVKKLDALSEKVRTLRDLQSSQSADLKSIKQSILHEVFAT